MGIDAFLSDLFGGSDAPATLADRFAPATGGLDTALSTHNAPLPRMRTSAENDAYGRLATGLRERADFNADPNIGQVEKDQRAATENAYQSGDYAPAPGGGMNYQPWDPRAGGPPAPDLDPTGASPGLPTPGMIEDLSARRRLAAPPTAPGGPTPVVGSAGDMPVPTFGAPPAAPSGGGDLRARLAGIAANPFAAVTAAPPTSAPAGVTSGDARSVLGRLIGMDAAGEKRFRSSLAGGFAGANPAFAGGAFMKGAGGAITGGLKSDKEETEAEVAAEEREQKSKQFERAQTEKEKTGESLRGLYGARAEALENPTPKGLPYTYVPGKGRDESGAEVEGSWRINKLDGTREFIPDMKVGAGARPAQAYTYISGKGTGADGKEVDGAWRINKLDGTREFVPGMKLTSRAPAHSRWDKPFTQRYKEATDLVLKNDKAEDAKAFTKADRAAAAERKAQFRTETYKRMGINADGSDPEAGGGATPSPETPRRPVTESEAKKEKLYDDSWRGRQISKAREYMAANPHVTKEMMKAGLAKQGITDLKDDELD